jgi:hypothetical protein
MSRRKDEMARGTWHYAGRPHIAGDVRITRQNWDSALVDEDGNLPSLMPAGEWAYYVEWAAPFRRGRFYTQSRRCASTDEARSLAEALVREDIAWEFHSPSAIIDAPLSEEEG